MTNPLILPSGVTSQRLAHPQGAQMLNRSCMKGLLTVVSYWTAMAHLLLVIQKSTPMWVKSNKLIWKDLVHNLSHITYLPILTLCVAFLPRLSVWRLWAGWCSLYFVWSNRVIRQWMSGPWSRNWTLEKTAPSVVCLKNTYSLTINSAKNTNMNGLSYF